MTNMMFMLMMFCAGITVAIQPSINARLAQKVGVIESACISFAVGTIALYLVLLLSGRGMFRGAGGTAWWEWTGGILGAVFVSTTIIVVPRIGTAAAMAATIAAQLITGIVLDHFGFFGFQATPVDAKRAFGALLLIGGAMLIRH